jgi:PEP-CTERM motif
VPGGGTPVPAPATLVLMASGLLLLRRAHKAKVVNLP